MKATQRLLRAGGAGPAAGFAAALCGATAAAAPPFPLAPLLDCRAVAIVQLARVDPENAQRRGLAQAVLEQANLAIILGVWGAPLPDVAAATCDMADGERLLIEAAQRVTALNALWAKEGPFDDRIDLCAAVAWSAAKAVIDPIVGERRAR